MGSQRSGKKGITVTEVVAIVFLVAIVAALLWPVQAGGDRRNARKYACLSVMKQQALAAIMYADDFDDRLPVATSWQTLVKPYDKIADPFCPSLGDRRPGQYGHAFRRDVGSLKTAKVAHPNETVMLLDSTDLSFNATGGFDLLPPEGRHLDGFNSVAFIDGHAWARRMPELARYLLGVKMDP